MKRWVGAVAAVIIISAGGAAYWWHTSRRPPRVSQPASVMQMLGGTRLDVRYNQPSARGRKLFGGIVPYGQVWDPGADEATTFNTGRLLQFSAQPLTSVTYGVCTIPASTH